MANKTIYGCVNRTTGVITFEGEACDSGNYVGCRVLTGEHAGQVEVVILEAYCDDTYYGCVNRTTGKFQLIIPDDCCEHTCDECGSVATVVMRENDGAGWRTLTQSEPPDECDWGFQVIVDPLVYSWNCNFCMVSQDYKTRLVYAIYDTRIPAVIVDATCYIAGSENIILPSGSCISGAYTNEYIATFS